MTANAKAAVVALRRSHNELVTFVQDSDADVFERPSGASEWKVADVLSHLGSAAEIGFHTLTTGKSDMEGAQAIWARWNAMSPGEQAKGFISADEALVGAFEALDDDALADRSIDLGFLPEPIDVAFFAGMRLSEVGFHTWDIMVPIDPAATVPDHLVPFVLDVMLVFAPFFAKSTGKTAHISVETIEPAGGYVLALSDGGTQLSAGQAPAAGTRLVLPAEAFLRLIGGRLDPSHTPPALSIEGELSLDDLRQVFPGY